MSVLIRTLAVAGAINAVMLAAVAADRQDGTGPALAPMVPAELYGGRSIRLSADGQAAATIVAGTATRKAAAELQAELLKLTRLRFEIVSDEQATEEHTFHYSRSVRNRTLILLGNVDTNQAFLSPYSRFMVAANSMYPGPGRYVLRTLFEPLHAGGDILVVGGSDEAGLAAGVTRLAGLTSAAVDAEGNCTLRPLIEFGDAEGPKPLETPRPGADFRSRAYAFFWYAEAGAAQWLKQHLADELANRQPNQWTWAGGGHYAWESNYRALLQVLASGLLTDEQIAKIADGMFGLLTKSKDGFGARVLAMSPEAFQARCTRHMLSAFTGQLLLADYLHNIAQSAPPRKQIVAGVRGRLHAILRSFTETGRFRGGLEGAEGVNVMDNLANLLFYQGDRAVMASDVFKRMADFKVAIRDNLGCATGIDSYIGCRPGMHAARTGTGSLGQAMEIWLRKNRQQLWLARNLGGGFGYLHVAFPPHFAAAEATLTPAPPESYAAVQVLALDGYLARLAGRYAGPGTLTTIDTEPGPAFDKVVFRDGLGRDDAYLLLQGANISAPLWREGIQGNAIIRYTELASLWLFQNTQIQGSWARSVVRVSRGEHDPQSSACVATASFSGGTVAAVQSLQQENGGSAWRRTILRRRGGYFVVGDELTAHHDDDYSLTCQWRCFQPGRFVNDRRFVAVDANRGTEMHIVSARPHANCVEQADRDGSADPLFARQGQDLRLAKGQSATFVNLIYATGGPAERRFDLRHLSPGAAIVRGKTTGFDECALISTGPLDGAAGVASDAKISYVSQDLLLAAGATRVAWSGVAVEADARFNLELPANGAAVIENPTDTPVTLRLALAEAPASARALPPGRHDLAELAGRLPGGQIAAELDKLWNQDAPAADRSTESRPADSSPLTAAWTTPVFNAPPRLHHRIGLSVESDDPISVDGLLDRDHHRWSPGTTITGRSGWAMTLDLGSPVEVDSVRFIGPRGGYRFPTGLRFDVEIDPDAPQTSRQRMENVEPSAEPWYSEMEQYTYTDEHAALRIPIRARAAKIRLRAKVHEASRPDIYAQEVQVFVRNGGRVKARLTAIENAEGTGVIAVGHDEVARLDADGNIAWRWEADSKIIASFVQYSEHEKAWLIGVWPVSNRFVLLDSRGECVLDPEVYEKDPESTAEGVFAGSSRPGAVMLWHREASKPGRIAFFPHVQLGQIRRTEEGMRLETASRHDLGGKAALRTPDVTGDGCEDLFVVGRYENCNGVLASQFAGADNWWRAGGWTGWSAGNMELPMYHDAAKVMRRGADGAQWLGVVALNPGGVDYYALPEMNRAWGRFNHPGNLCHAVGDLTGDGVDEIIVGREDGFAAVYDAPTGRQIAKKKVPGRLRSICISDQLIIAGTSDRLVVMTKDGRAVSEARGAVESIVVSESRSGHKQIVVGFSDGSIKGFTP